MKKKGFTLVELLAVIVILAIILAIAIPGISNMIKSSTKSAFESDAKMVLKAVEYKKLEDSAFTETDINQDSISELLGLSNDNYSTLTIAVKDNISVITIVGKNKWDGLTACGSYTNIKVVEDESECGPDLIPPVITLNGDSTITIYEGDIYSDAGAIATDNKDGDITSNIVATGSINTLLAGTYTITYTVKDIEGNTSTLIRTVKVLGNYAGPNFRASKGVNGPNLAEGMVPIKWDGSAWVDTTIFDADWYDYTITDKKWANARTADGSMWVWIPRYAYQITTGYHSSTAGTISIKFLKDNTNTSIDSTQIYEDNATSTHFVKHPAFNFGETELTGIWVAKFEASGTTTSLDSKAGVISLRSTTIGNAFKASRNMETNNKYGWALASSLNTDGTFTTDTNSVDTHMIKNMEWGAVAYLSQSTYGKNEEITINSSSSFSSIYTGGGAGNAYVTNVGQSTTGNIYGIYDMSGGARENVMGNYGNDSGDSGFSPSIIHNKYIDRYTAYNSTKYGDAVYETSMSGSGSTSWNSDSSIMHNSTCPWFYRGGDWDDGSNAGVFNFNRSVGGASSNDGFRMVLAVSVGL